MESNSNKGVSRQSKGSIMGMQLNLIYSLSNLVLSPAVIQETAQLLLDVWVGGQQVRGTGEGQGGRVVCSKEEDEAV